MPIEFRAKATGSNASSITASLILACEIVGVVPLISLEEEGKQLTLELPEPLDIEVAALIMERAVQIQDFTRQLRALEGTIDDEDDSEEKTDF